MSKYQDFATKCPCGAEMHLSLEKPSAIRVTIMKMKCENCKSRFKIESYKENGEFKVSFDIIELTPQATAIVQKYIDEQNLVARDKEAVVLDA